MLYLQRAVKRSVGLLLRTGTAFPSAFVFFSAAAERCWEARGSSASVGLQIHGQRPPSLREQDRRGDDDELLEGEKKKRKRSHSLRRRQLPQGGDLSGGTPHVPMFPVAALNIKFDCNKKKILCIKMDKVIRNFVLGCPTAAK